MIQRALRDGNVWLALGMLWLGLYFGLEQWSGTGGAPDFLRGFFVGLAIVAYAVSFAMLVSRHADSPQKPARKSSPRPKGRR